MNQVRALNQGTTHTGDAARWTWADDAACAGQPLWLFYGHDNERPEQRLVRETRALEFCQSCPMRTFTACREAALDASPGQQYGVQGGLTAEERTNVRRNRMRAEQAARQKAVA